MAEVRAPHTDTSFLKDFMNDINGLLKTNLAEGVSSATAEGFNEGITNGAKKAKKQKIDLAKLIEVENTKKNQIEKEIEELLRVKENKTATTKIQIPDNLSPIIDKKTKELGSSILRNIGSVVSKLQVPHRQALKNAQDQLDKQIEKDPETWKEGSIFEANNRFVNIILGLRKADDIHLTKEDQLDAKAIEQNWDKINDVVTLIGELSVYTKQFEDVKLPKYTPHEGISDIFEEIRDFEEIFMSFPKDHKIRKQYEAAYEQGRNYGKYDITHLLYGKNAEVDIPKKIEEKTKELIEIRRNVLELELKNIEEGLSSKTTVEELDKVETKLNELLDIYGSKNSLNQFDEIDNQVNRIFDNLDKINDIRNGLYDSSPIVINDSIQERTEDLKAEEKQAKETKKAEDELGNALLQLAKNSEKAYKKGEFKESQAYLNPNIKYISDIIEGTINGIDEEVSDALKERIADLAIQILAGLHVHSSSIATPSYDDFFVFADEAMEGIFEQFILGFREITKIDLKGLSSDEIEKIGREMANEQTRLFADFFEVRNLEDALDSGRDIQELISKPIDDLISKLRDIFPALSDTNIEEIKNRIQKTLVTGISKSDFSDLNLYDIGELITTSLKDELLKNTMFKDKKSLSKVDRLNEDVINTITDSIHRVLVGNESRLGGKEVQDKIQLMQREALQTVLSGMGRTTSYSTQKFNPKNANASDVISGFILNSSVKEQNKELDKLGERAATSGEKASIAMEKIAEAADNARESVEKLDDAIDSINSSNVKVFPKTYNNTSDSINDTENKIVAFGERTKEAKEELEKLGYSADRVFSEIGLSYDEYVNKINSQKRGMDWGERLATVVDGKIQDSIKGTQIQVGWTDDVIIDKLVEKILHFHPQGKGQSEVFSSEDILEFFEKVLSKGYNVPFELWQNGQKTSMDFRGIPKQYISHVVTALSQVQEIVAQNLKQNNKKGTIKSVLDAEYQQLTNSLFKAIFEKYGGKFETEKDYSSKIDPRLVRKNFSILEEYTHYIRGDKDNKFHGEDDASSYMFLKDLFKNFKDEIIPDDSLEKADYETIQEKITEYFNQIEEFGKRIKELGGKAGMVGIDYEKFETDVLPDDELEEFNKLILSLQQALERRDILRETPEIKEARNAYGEFNRQALLLEDAIEKKDKDAYQMMYNYLSDLNEKTKILGSSEGETYQDRLKYLSDNKLDESVFQEWEQAKKKQREELEKEAEGYRSLSDSYSEKEIEGMKKAMMNWQRGVIEIEDIMKSFKVQEDVLHAAMKGELVSNKTPDLFEGVSGQLSFIENLTESEVNASTAAEELVDDLSRVKDQIDGQMSFDDLQTNDQVDYSVQSEEKLLPMVIESTDAIEKRNEEMRRMQAIQQAFMNDIGQSNEAKINRDITETLEQRRQEQEKLNEAKQEEVSTSLSSPTAEVDIKAEESAKAVEKEAETMTEVKEESEKASTSKKGFAKANAEVLQSIKESLSGLTDEAELFKALNNIINKFSGKGSDERISTLANNIVKIKDALTGSINDNSFISALQKLSEQGENLKDLADILKASRKQIESAKDIIDNSNELSQEDRDALVYQLSQSEEYEREQKRILAIEKEIEKARKEGQKQAEAYTKKQLDEQNALKNSITEYVDKLQEAINADNIAKRTGAGVSKDLANRWESLKAQLGNIDVTVDTSKAKEEFNKLKENIDIALSPKERKFEKVIPEEVITNLGSQIEDFGAKNTKLSKELRDRLEEVRKRYQMLLNSGASGNALERELKSISSEFNKIKADANAAGQAGKNFGHMMLDSLKSANARFIANYLSIQDMIRYIRTIATTITEVDSALTELRKVSNATNIRLQQNFEKSAETAKELGSTITDVINQTADWARLGYNVDDAEKLARVTTLFQTVGDNMTAETASEAMISTLKAYGIAVDQSERIVDQYNEVANNFAIDTAGLADSITRAGAALHAGGNALSESMGLVVAANDSLQDPSSVGQMLKTMSMRLRGASVADLEELGIDTTGMSQGTKSIVQQFKAMAGIDIMEGTNYKSTFQILDELHEKWADLTDAEHAALTEAVGGKRGGSVMSSLMENWADAKAVVEQAENSTGSAMREQQNYAQSIQYSIDRTKASFQELQADLISSDSVKVVVEMANSLINAVDKIVTNKTALVAIFSTITSAFAVKNNVGGLKNTSPTILSYSIV